MIEIDGAEKSGSGTIVRYSIALAALLGQPLHVVNARARREKPGLRPQHAAAARACAELCGAAVDGLHVGSTEFTFIPAGPISRGSFAWDIGTAGSATMLALGVLPLAAFAPGPVCARITGGLFQDFAPSPHHLQHVLAPALRRMGLSMDLKLIRAGYVPRGSGVVELSVRPAPDGLKALDLEARGPVAQVRGIAFASHLEERRVPDRMARACETRLRQAGLFSRIRRVNDTGALHPGASLAVWVYGSDRCLLGADRAGERGRSSEAVGRFVAEGLLEDLATEATVDRHLADMLVLFAALAHGTTSYLAPRRTTHLETNLWLAEKFGARCCLDGTRVRIEGIGFKSHG